MRALLIACLPLLAAAASPFQCAPGSDHPCWDFTKELDARKEAEGLLPPGAEYPTCDLLGKYAPKQCSGSQCYCVDPDGGQLQSYTKNRWEADGMACRCARREHEISLTGRLGVTIDCDEQGDYHHTQCTGSVCYCAHPVTGEEQVNTSGDIGDYVAISADCAVRTY